MRITVLGSGSRGNCTILESGGNAIMIDTGFSFKKTAQRMQEAGIDSKKIKGVLITHEHSDHIKSLRTVTTRFKIPVYANVQTTEAIKEKHPAITDYSVFVTGDAFVIDNFVIEPFSLPHDAIDPVGFVIKANGKKAVIATDLGHAGTLVQYHLKDADFIMLETNHDPDMLQQSSRPWHVKQRIKGKFGHLSNEDALKTLEKVVAPNTKVVVFAHASGECNDYSLLQNLMIDFIASFNRNNLKGFVLRQEEWTSIQI
ncbi:MAG: MBL fold metallo-hydrolase [Verrucomicrobiota bacterium]|nr:MBL fold metallo-hydrolase [Verrucomicrobiota bacterium]